MTDIPEDIHAKASELVSKIAQRLEATGVARLGHLLSPGEWSANAIAQALMEERERCAKIAIALTRETVTDDDHIMRVAVAAAIRTTGSIVAAAILDPHSIEPNQSGDTQ